MAWARKSQISRSIDNVQHEGGGSALDWRVGASHADSGRWNKSRIICTGAESNLVVALSVFIRVPSDAGERCTVAAKAGSLLAVF